MIGLRQLLPACSALAVLCVAAPASAQYYPGYGYGYSPPGDIVGRVVNDVLGTGYGYGPNSQFVVSECTRAVQARLSGYGNGYGYGYGYGGGRVLGVSQVSPRADGGIAVRGIASVGYWSNRQIPWRCRTDARGFVRQVTLNPSDAGYGYGYGYSGDYDYSPYGYRRY